MALTPKTPAPSKPGQKPSDDKRAQSDEVFLREVDDAVRSSDLQSFWTRYGRWLVALVVIGLAAFGGWIYYQNQQDEAAGKQSEEFVAVLDGLENSEEAKRKEAETKLAALTKAEQPGFRAMAQLMQANMEAEKEDKTKAAAAYAKIAADTSIPEAFRNMALLRQTLLEFDTLEPQAVITRLKPLAKPGNPWFGSAGEMTALAHIKMGKEDLAGPIFVQIAKEENLPPTLTGRAEQMASSLGFEVVQLDENNEPASGDTDASSKGESK